MSEFIPSKEQQRIFDFNKKNMVISASAGSGKTTTMLGFISRLIQKGLPVKRLLVLTFTKAAATQMRERLILQLLEKSADATVQSQIDELFTSDICTIHSFLEKIIKRNLAQFPYLENFSLLDEKQAMLLKDKAFEEAQQKFKQQNGSHFYNLFLTLRSQKLIKEIVLKIEDYLACQADKEKALKDLANYKVNYEKAQTFLLQILHQKISQLFEDIDTFLPDNAKVENFLQQLKACFVKNDNLREQAKCICEISLPRLPILSGYERKEEVKLIKNEAQEIVKFAQKLQPENQFVWQSEQTQTLIDELICLYKIYFEVYSNKKTDSNLLDFDDLEIKSEELLTEQDILKQLQENHDFVFIDEYQDTNPVQEKIVKLIAQKAKFIAIGDPKQGIYAFRNATSKIILQDSEQFEKDEDSQTEYLSQNYRSDKDILNFVNAVFSKIMTAKTTGIDYKKTSMLKGDNAFSKVKNLAGVNILLAQKAQREKAQVAEEYDIFDDKLSNDEENDLEAQIVASKIEELLTSFFIDAKTGEKVRVQPKDIAVLSRSRSNLTNSIANNLRKKGISFVSTMRSDLLSKANIKMIVSLLKLCCDQNDDIALASYLLSPMVRISMDKLALIAKDTKDFCQSVLQSEDEEIKGALKLLQQFKLQCLFLGAKKALEKLFLQTEYFVYLQSALGENAVKEMEALLCSIATFENDKDLPGLYAYLNSDLTFSSVAGENAVTISSIHASKGLEYKIVFVVGADKPFVRADNSQFRVCDNFGLALCCYDDSAWSKSPSLALLSSKEYARHKERADELMVSYVALTRAKNHLFVTATLDYDKDYQKDAEKSNSLIEAILNCDLQGCGAKVEQIQEVVKLNANVKVSPIVDVDKNSVQKIKNYLNFVYPFKEETLIKQKASVTELASKGKDFSSSNSDAIEVGNAFHEALRLLDFDRVNKAQDVKNILIEKKLQENYLNLINFQLIFEIINLIKPLTKNKKIIKEKQFTMRLPLSQGARTVQGTIDLYLKGDKNILIDYKYTSQKDENVLKERYAPQLMLYKQAIENAENIVVDEIYLISIKNKQLIKF